MSTVVQRVLAIVALVVLAGVLVFAFFDDATHRPVPPQGDMLGADSGESFTAYAARAEASLIDAPALRAVRMNSRSSTSRTAERT